jgi:hypothetical protein
MTTKLAGTVVGAAIVLASGSALAQEPGIYTLNFHSGDNAGRAYENEEGNRNNNDQLGAGIEHTRCNIMKAAAGGPRIMCVGTGSYTDLPGSPVQDRVQALCISHRLDPMVGLVKTAARYITNNRGDEYQNGHVPVAAPVFGGTAMAVYYNYDPDNNTKLWGKILGPDCEELTGQTLLLAKQNDDVLGHASNPVVVYDSPTETRLGSCGIGNGNGRDDGWCIGVRVTNNAGQVALATYFDKSVVAEEERSRMAVSGTNIPDHILECAAEGNAQPPNRGTRCALINTAPNTPNENRVVWRQYIQEREGRIYATTPALAPVLAPDGSFTDEFVVNYVEVNTENRNGREKGATSLKTVPIKVTLAGLEMLDTPRYNQAGFGDQAHQHMCAVNWGPQGKPGTMVIQGSVVGSVTGVPRASVINYDPVTKKTSLDDEIVFGDSYDTGWISQYYGNNPNTPQGRNHSYCMMVDNPGYGVAGGFQPTVKQFVFAANTPRRLRIDGTPEDKLAFDMVLIPAVIPDDGTGPDPDPDPEPDPEPDPDPAPDPDGSGAQVGGCSTGGGAGAGSLLLLGFAATLIRRRRR